MRDVKLRHWGLFLYAIVPLFCVLTPLNAAKADSNANTPQSSSDDVETIIVTARRRAENLQETPIAVTALTNATLENRGFTELSDIAKATPSLTFNGSAPISGNPAAASVFIRGIGQIDFASNTDPGVGIYLDGVYIARSVGSVLELVDPERIEVLRGPQGTLFGRNTIGGAINIVSSAPSTTFGGKVSLTTGSDSLKQAQSSVNIPISDTLLTQFSIFAKYRDGYVGRPGGDDLGDDGKVAGRGSVEWLPMEDLTVTFSADRTRTREDGSGNVPIQLNGVSFNGVGGGFKSLYNNVVIGAPCTNPVTANTSRSCYGTAWQTTDPYYTNSTYPSKANSDVWGTALTTDWRPGPVGIKSITAFRGVSSEFGRDADNTPFNLQFTYNTVKQQQFSEELQFSGVALTDQFKWLLGLYYFEEFAKDYSVLGGPVEAVTAFNQLHNSNYAVFGEATYDFTHWLHLTMGGRWTSETKRMAADQVVTGGFLLPIGENIVVDPSEHSLTVTNFSPRVTLAADLTDGLMTYFTYSKGFKSGGFNERYTTQVPAPVSYNPEYLTLNEVGIKYVTPSHNLRLNMAGFTEKYQSIQINFNSPFQLGNVTGNEGAGRITGGEAEFDYVPVAGLHLDGGYSYLDAHYTQINPLVGGITLRNRFVLTPKNQASLSAAYDVGLNGHGTLTPRFDWAFRSAFYMDTLNTPSLLQKSYSVFNTGLTYETEDRLWRVATGVTNVTDKQYLTSGVASRSAGLAEGVYARPREWFLTVKRSF